MKIILFLALAAGAFFYFSPTPQENVTTTANEIVPAKKTGFEKYKEDTQAEFEKYKEDAQKEFEEFKSQN